LGGTTTIKRGKKCLGPRGQKNPGNRKLDLYRASKKERVGDVYVNKEKKKNLRPPDHEGQFPNFGNDRRTQRDGVK